MFLFFTLFVYFNNIHTQAFTMNIEHHFNVDRVIDGDTIKLDTSKENNILKELGLSVRIYGIDTPEKAPRAKCASEDKLGQKATQFTKDIIGKKQIVIEPKKWDKYGGRIDAIVKVDGVSIGDELIKRGLARAYFGEAKQSWCK